MRPVERGDAPRSYANYQDAKPDLVARMGTYCNYCERALSHLVAVEHIQAKSIPEFAHLETEWNNFLLACGNCNPAKNAKPVEPEDVLLPDRDNTFAAFAYDEFGQVNPAPSLPPQLAGMAQRTIDLVALNRVDLTDDAEPDVFCALGRVGQRIAASILAQDAKTDYEAGQIAPKHIARQAASGGFFSIWMTAFDGIPEVRQALIDTFPGTARSCFDESTNPITPRPENGLPGAGKI